MTKKITPLPEITQDSTNEKLHERLVSYVAVSAVSLLAIATVVVLAALKLI